MLRISLVCCVLAGCTLDPTPERGDQLDQQGSATFESDGGVSLERALPSPQQPAPPPTHSCHDPCPAMCGTDEACCHATAQCVPLDCRECCPDANFGFDELALGAR